MNVKGNFEAKLTEFAKKDYDKLDGSQKQQVLKSFQKIKELGMQAGEELHGKLWDCRKLKHRKLGLRVVFKQSDTRLNFGLPRRE